MGRSAGLELLQAHFGGRGFEPHRHDTYGIAVTDVRVQTFDYRGALERSMPRQVTVLHPDEKHDGRAGTEGGLGYRILTHAKRPLSQLSYRPYTTVIIRLGERSARTRGYRLSPTRTAGDGF